METYAACRNADDAPAIAFRMSPAVAPSARFRFQTDGMSYTRVPEVAGNTLLAAVVQEQTRAEELFAVLAADVARYVNNGPIAGSGSRLAERLLQWQNALRTRHANLSREAATGLFGELEILLALCGHIPAAAAVEAWKGPEDGVQDFSRNGIAIEVKSTAVSQVRVSSLDQLDGRPLRRLALAVVHLLEDPHGESLTSLVARARAAAGGSTLDAKLALGGWRDNEAERCEEFCFRRARIDVFRVVEGFPAVTRENVPAGVSEASYRLDVRALHGFEAPPDALADLAREMTGID